MENHSCGIEYQVEIRGREYQGCGEEGKGEQYHIPFDIKTVGMKKVR